MWERCVSRGAKYDFIAGGKATVEVGCGADEVEGTVILPRTYPFRSSPFATTLSL